MYSCICFLFRPTVSTKYPLAQKWRSPYLYFKFACLSNIIKLLFPLRYPMICDTLYLGGILMSIWIWSGHACASIIYTPFCSHNFLKICPISLLIWPYITILRYFGANTTWYWHLHLVCCRLAISFSIKKDLLGICCAVGRPHFHYTSRSFHYIILSTLPGIAGGSLFAKANQSGPPAKPGAWVSPRRA